MSSDGLVLKWGIISCGKISQDFCTALLTLNSDHHKLEACAARNMTDSKNFAERFNITSHYDSYEDLITNKEVNIVYIGK